MRPLVSRGTAEVLRRKGFDGKCEYCYVISSIVKAEYCEDDDLRAPDIYQVSEWLRTRNVHIEVSYDSYDCWSYRAVRCIGKRKELYEGRGYGSHDNAVRAGIDKVLQEFIL